MPRRQLDPNQAIVTPAQLDQELLVRLCEQRNVRVDDIKAPGRRARIQTVRKAIIREFAVKRPTYSSTKLGEIFDRDHTTILHALGRRKTGGCAPGVRSQRELYSQLRLAHLHDLKRARA